MRENLNVILNCLCDQMDNCPNCPFVDEDCLNFNIRLDDETYLNRLANMAEYIRHNL